MDRRERIESLPAAILATLQGWQADMWTATPAIVASFNEVEMTCVVQPTTRFKISRPALDTYKSETMLKDPSGEYAWDQMPLLLDCPVVFPCGGGVTLTFPIKQGDEVLIVLASRCIDAWWQQGGIQNQAVLRMHDLSDGFVLPGVRSLPRVIPNVNTTTAQFRTDDGQTFVEVNPVNHNVRVITPTDVYVDAGNNVNVIAGNDISASAGNNITAYASANVAVTAGSNITANAGGDISATASGNIVAVAGGNLTATATTATLNAATINLNGNVAISGGLSVASGASISGAITNNGVNIGSSHVHGGVYTGTNDTSGPH